jgi:molecular chaperone DnaJ
MLRKSYYLTLGISHNESAEGIRQAFHEIVKRYHPDRVGSERLRFFQEIVEAYRVLGDPERRRNYDRGLYQAGLTTSAPLAPAMVGSGQGDLPLAMAVLRNLTIKDAPFEAALARVSGRLTTAQVNSNEFCEGLNTVVILSPNEAIHGGMIVLAVPSCSPCDRCGGSGRDGLFPCTLCDGEGLIEEQETVRVQVLPLVGDGTVINVPLRGLGVHNFYLRLHIRVGSAMSPAAHGPVRRETPRMSID